MGNIDDDDTLVGVMTYWIEEDYGFIEIFTLIVEENIRDRNIGSGLLEQVNKIADREEYK